MVCEADPASFVSESGVEPFTGREVFKALLTDPSEVFQSLVDESSEVFKAEVAQLSAADFVGILYLAHSDRAGIAVGVPVRSSLNALVARLWFPLVGSWAMGPELSIEVTSLMSMGTVIVGLSYDRSCNKSSFDPLYPLKA